MEGDNGKVRFAKKRTIYDYPRDPNSLLLGGFAYLSQPGPPETLVPHDRGVRKIRPAPSSYADEFPPSRKRVPHSERSETARVSQKKAIIPKASAESAPRPLKQYFPEKSGLDEPEDTRLRPLRRIGYPAVGTLNENPSQVSLEKSFGRKRRIAVPASQEATGHAAAVYKPGFFQSSKTMRDDAQHYNTRTIDGLQFTRQRMYEKLSEDARAVFELTNNVRYQDKEIDSWEKRTGLYVYKPKHVE